MISNLDPKTCIEYDVNFNGINAIRVTRTYCDLCGDVIAAEIEYCDGRIEIQDLKEFHTGCCE